MLSTYGPGKAAYGGHWRPPENERSGRHSAFRHDDKGLTEFTVTGQKHVKRRTEHRHI